MTARLHAIVDVDTATRAGWRADDLARAYLDGGAKLLQLRAKTLHSAALLALCDDVVAAAAGAGAEVIVNDRVDVARLSGAAGVHLGQDDVPTDAARAQLGAAAFVGVSTHTLAQVDVASRQPVSYLAVGPVFRTSTKDTGYAAVGLDFVRTARERVPAHIPIVAIGGITLEQAPMVLAAGASAVAVIGDLLTETDPRARVAAYARALM